MASVPQSKYIVKLHELLIVIMVTSIGIFAFEFLFRFVPSILDTGIQIWNALEVNNMTLPIVNQDISNRTLRNSGKCQIICYPNFQYNYWYGLWMYDYGCSTENYSLSKPICLQSKLFKESFNFNQMFEMFSISISTPVFWKRG